MNKYTSRTEVGGANIENNSDISKLLHSVGSLKLFSKSLRHFQDIIPYNLCTYCRDTAGNQQRHQGKKDLHTTELIDYVIKSLERINKSLTSDQIENLSTIVGEILINAEEHSTTKYRFSIGYFQEYTKDKKHFGIFKLVILNFGKSIYEKFKDPDCPNKDNVEKMKTLSKKYTENGYFSFNGLEEESLWTLYALQEAITSVSTDAYLKRGNGSIQFIESFFNLRGQFDAQDPISRMVILSGATSIKFDGTYKIIEKKSNSETFKYMTFNKSGNIEDKPDNRFVKHTNTYFPGTLISTQILFNDESENK
ncbi:hypothetical protein [Flectobacillus roseus]|uniref:hypothetical protein n=1 Tax=Flectobacillus roseus TaxID=502259 RepID=UPI0024B74DBA|nr:hypothetical protein [Flectobacillus roseus]MDI9871093.1 hypothetical protein [Flectobacillus roseus]